LDGTGPETGTDFPPAHLGAVAALDRRSRPPADAAPGLSNVAPEWSLRKAHPDPRPCARWVPARNPGRSPAACPSRWSGWGRAQVHSGATSLKEGAASAGGRDLRSSAMTAPRWPENGLTPAAGYYGS